MEKNKWPILTEGFSLSVGVSNSRYVNSQYNLEIEIYEKLNGEKVARYYTKNPGLGSEISGEVPSTGLGRSKLKVKIRKNLTMRLEEKRRKENRY